MFERFDDKTRLLLVRARAESFRLGAPTTSVEHVVLAALRSEFPERSVAHLTGCGVTVDAFENMLRAAYPNPVQPSAPPMIDRLLAAAVSTATDTAIRRGARTLDADLVVYAAVASAKESTVLGAVLTQLTGGSALDVARQLYDLLELDEPVPEAEQTAPSYQPVKDRFAATGYFAGSTDSVLERFGVDLTASARNGRLDVPFGRERETDELIATLLRRTKNNAVLVGDPGVGKTAVVHGLAARIASGDVPEELVDAVVLDVDPAELVSGTRTRGDFETRVKALLKALEQQPSTVVFIDEIHQIMGVGASGTGGGVALPEMLKPALSRGELRMVGATTWDEYRKIFATDAALDRRFRPVTIDAPSPAATRSILGAVADRFENHHGVVFEPASLDATVSLAARFFVDRQFPDAAIDVVDEVGAAAGLARLQLPAKIRDVATELATERRTGGQRVEQLEETLGALDAPPVAYGRIDQSFVEQVVAEMASVPADVVAADEAARFADLPERLAEVVYDQRPATDAVARGVRRRRAGLGDPGRPPSFLFCGPSGTGKTETARALAQLLYGDADRLVHLDMSEYQERHTVARLVGAPPGYVGHDDPGQLTEPVRRLRSCVVLLDEIDKAHRDVADICLQLLDGGRLTDGSGRRVDFSDTVVIATCNVAAAATRRTVGFATFEGEQLAASEVSSALADQFRPEFLNRFDEIVRFDELSPATLAAIVVDELERVAARLDGVELRWTPEVVAHLAASGADPAYGARPVRRAVQTEVTDAVTAFMFDSSERSNRVLQLDLVDGSVACTPVERRVRQPVHVV